MDPSADAGPQSTPLSSKESSTVDTPFREIWRLIYFGIPELNRIQADGFGLVGGLRRLIRRQSRTANTLAPDGRKLDHNAETVDTTESQSNPESTKRNLYELLALRTFISNFAMFISLMLSNNINYGYASAREDDLIYKILDHFHPALKVWSFIFLGTLFRFLDPIIVAELEKWEAESPHCRWRPGFWNVWVIISLPFIFTIWQLLVAIAAAVWFWLRKSNRTVAEIALPEPPFSESLCT